MFLKVIACEIAFREISYLAARSPNLIETDFLTQGYHDIPKTGCRDIQQRIEAVPEGRFDAILLGYGLCSSILVGLKATHTPLVIPRAHDCITFFMGSKERYQQLFSERPGTYYYTSGWLECIQRRGDHGAVWGGASLPASAGAGVKDTYEKWVKKYGEEEAKFLMEEMNRWTEGYTHGVLINFDFAKHLKLDQQVRQICAERHWEFGEIDGDLSLFQRWLDGDWAEKDFLVVKPGEEIFATFDERVVEAKPRQAAD